MDSSSLDKEDLDKRTEKFSLWEWNFGKKIEFSDSLERRFGWEI